jgi:tRNA threonylcarbamoyladenosine biosynthesis protein TsaB
MKILAFDTATAACTVALLVGSEVRERSVIAPQRHAELILPMIEQLLAEAGLALGQLDAIAVGQGPGSFMGVRIAVGVAQGLAFGADLPVVTVSTLQALAQTAYEQTQASEVIAAWDARMQAVYWGAYCLGEHQLLWPVVADTLSAPDEVVLPSGTAWRLAGNAWQAYRQPLLPLITAHPDVIDIYPQASAILRLAQVLYRQGKARSPLEIEPTYLRDKIV